MFKGQILLIYNPNSGQKSFSEYLDQFVQVYQDKGYGIHLFRTNEKEDFARVINEVNLSNYKALFVAGGDGSIHHVINVLMKKDETIPLGVIPAGTMNDFCFNAGISNDIGEAIHQLSSMKFQMVDVGVANDVYFLNTCGAGLFMDISQNTETQLKNILGRAAYFITGIKELPNFKKISLSITNDDSTIEEEFFFFIIMNGTSAGGFHNLGNEASLNDGYLDFIGIKACSLNELSVLFAKILMGNHLSDKNIVYFKSKNIRIDNIKNTGNETSDVDGEKGPNLPLEVNVIPKKLQMIIP